MEIQIGRFKGYKPDINPLDILRAIFLFIDRQKEYDSNPFYFQRFFFKMKSKHPDLFKDIYFNDDSWLSYSREIDWAFVRTQESKTTSRPNPDFYSFKINAGETRLRNEIKGKFTEEQRNALKEIAKEFEKEMAIKRS